MATYKEYSRNFLNFRTQIEADTPVYRVIPIKRLLDLIQDKTNVLVHPSMWDDPYENFLLKSKFKWNGFNIDVSNLRDRVFGQCWTLNSQETDALWRIYSPEKDGVRLKSSIKQVFAPLVAQNNDWYISAYFGKVRYFNQERMKKVMQNYVLESLNFGLTNGIDIIYSLMSKREAFKHEKEVRLVYRGTPNRSDKLHGYSINPQKFIHELLFDPRIDEQDYQNYKEQLQILIPKCLISHSDLYKGPDFTVIIKDE
ncbi:hypothetical protein MASR2M39_22060 [Ignavibacteriales bacterium]